MRREGGFTLVELLVVITIIAILSVIGITTYSGIQSRARDVQRLDDARKIIIALEAYKSGAGKYPNWKDPARPGQECQACTSQQGPTTWLRDLGTNDFINNTYPIDPKNTSSPDLIYYYWASDNGDSYCLQISQETNASSHPYYVQGTANPWKLKFGPKGASAGYCASVPVL